MASISLPRPKVFRFPRLRLPRRKPKAKREPKIVYRYENLIIFDEIEYKTYMVAAPRHELQEHMDHRSRFTGNKKPSQIMGFLFGGLIGVAALSAVFYFYLLFPTEFAIGLAFIPGFIMGGLPGLIVGGLFAPRPIWLLRRFEEVTEDGEIVHVWESVIHNRFRDNEFEIVSYDTDEGKAVGTLEPRVFRASTVYRMSKALDARKDYTGGTSGAQKLETMSIAMIALASVGIFVLFGITMQDTPAPSNTQATAIERPVQ